MDVVLRVLAGLILVLFVIGPISVAIGALVVHLWTRWRKTKSKEEHNSSRPGPQT
jgi:hypothetical protein